MIAEIQSRMFRPHSDAMDMRQHVTIRASQGIMSKRMAKLVTVIICISLFVVFAFSQVMHWQIVASSNKLEDLKTIRVATSSKNIELLATRAQLASRDFVEKQAKEKLQLFTPKRNQIRRL